MRIRILIYKLEQDLLCELRDALISMHIVPSIEEDADPGAMDWEQVDLVFCSAAPDALQQVLRTAASRVPPLRVIAASRLPDVRDWLQSIELGAADYCAPPFEESQLRWLIQTHATSGTTIAA